ncbi:PAS domain S-box protein [Nitrospira sp. NS4]|uniref:PAS domain S-box protein n=1 Tax=Nitrospira sp. NS4 TaxID=3414498 RepID=UPI003C2D088C
MTNDATLLRSDQRTHSGTPNDPFSSGGRGSSAIAQETVELLYAKSAGGLAASLAFAAVLVASHWSWVSHPLLLAWWSGMTLLTAARALLVSRFKTSDSGTSPATWFRKHLTGVLLSGVGWGAAGILLFTPDSVEHQAFLGLVLAGMIAVAAPVFSASRRTFLAFALPAGLPIIAEFFLIGDRTHLTVGLSGLIFMGIMTGLAWSLNRGLARTFTLGAERHQARTELLDLLERTHDLIQDVAPDGRLLFVNRAWRETLGYSTSEAAAQDIFDVLHPDSHDRCRHVMQQILAGGTVDLVELTFRTKSGRTVIAEGRVNVHVEHGRPVAARGMFRNITGRKIAEARLHAVNQKLEQLVDERTSALRERERLFRTLAEFSPVGLFRTDAAGQCLYVNDRLCEIARMSPEAAKGNGWTALIHPDDRERVAKEWANAAAERQPFRSEYRLQPADREICWVIGQAQAELDEQGDVAGYVGAMTDITDRKRAEEDLQAGRELFVLAFRSSPDPMGLWEVDSGLCLDVNDAFLNGFGYRREDLVGRTGEEIGYWETPESRPRFLQQLKHSGSIRHLEARVRTAGGTIRDCVVSAELIDYHGTPCMITIVKDSTDRRQPDPALQASQDQIRQKQKMEAIGQLAGGIAHDFNNILTAILGNAEIALLKNEADHPSRPNLARILEAGQRASHVVQQILTFTRQQDVSRTGLPLGPVVTEAFALLRATLPAGVELTHSCDPATPQVLANATQLQQVLMNLCTNAWHALGDKPGRIAIDLAPVTLTQPLSSPHATLPPGPYARLSVRDTGCGMPPETVARIFDPFFTTKPLGQGTGLGLSVVHGIVQGHDGAIVVESAPGQGTTFHLYFPAVETPLPAGEPAGAPRDTAPRRTCRMLYLDDEEMLVELVRALFEPLGYCITGCTKPADALEAVRADPDGFDVVVTDYNMPGLSGLEVARELADIRGTLPVVLVSGYLTPTDQDAALAANIREIVYKPTLLQELGPVLTRLVDSPPAQ